MRLDPGQRMAKAAERASKSVESAGKALERSARRRPERTGPKTAGDVLRETAESLGGAVGMSGDETTALYDDLVAVWTRHYTRP